MIKNNNTYERDYGLDKDLLAMRDLMYNAARVRNPERCQKDDRLVMIDHVNLLASIKVKNRDY